MDDITLSLSAVIVLIIVVFRAIFNYRHYQYATFALATTIIANDIAWTLLKHPLTFKYVMTNTPYQPLLLVVIMFILCYWFYQLLTCYWFRNKIKSAFPKICNQLQFWGRYIVIFLEIIATILAYQALINFHSQNIATLILSAKDTNPPTYAFIAILSLLGIRFVWNLFLGNYKTLVFWSLFIITLITYSMINSFIDLDAFAVTVIVYGYLNMWVFREVATEENLYWIYSKSGISEAGFAYTIHFLTAVAEAVACLMILSLFVDSYNQLLFG